MWLIPLVLLIVLEGVADIFSKQYALHGKWQYWLLAIGGYIVANIFWLSAIRNGSGLVRGAILFSVGSAVVAVFIGFVLFEERVSHLEMAGVATGIISIMLLVSSEV